MYKCQAGNNFFAPSLLNGDCGGLFDMMAGNQLVDDI